ncbi:MAG: c-type cytochrome [Proteobacteria bacterium]|nr:c-type cytochrome [Pseudomonadota bacterium]
MRRTPPRRRRRRKASRARTTSGTPRNYQWNAQEGEKIEALKLKGDKKRGEEAYEVCGACHLPSGAGRPDGTFPQLAGQHTTVLIKQMADIRAGLRDNPTMYPFAATLTDPQELADVSAYIESLCIPTEHGKYEGADAAMQVAKGKELYEKQCLECHGKNGEGNKEKFYPVIAGQHYKYLLRQMTPRRTPPQRQPGHGQGDQALHQRPAGRHLRLSGQPQDARIDVRRQAGQGWQEVSVKHPQYPAVSAGPMEGLHPRGAGLLSLC